MSNLDDDGIVSEAERPEEAVGDYDHSAVAELEADCAEIERLLQHSATIAERSRGGHETELATAARDQEDEERPTSFRSVPIDELDQRAILFSTAFPCLCPACRAESQFVDDFVGTGQSWMNGWWDVPLCIDGIAGDSCLTNGYLYVKRSRFSTGTNVCQPCTL